MYLYTYIYMVYMCKFCCKRQKRNGLDRNMLCVYALCKFYLYNNYRAGYSENRKKKCVVY